MTDDKDLHNVALYCLSVLLTRKKSILTEPLCYLYIAKHQ